MISIQCHCMYMGNVAAMETRFPQVYMCSVEIRAAGFDVWSVCSSCQDSRVHFLTVIGSRTILDYVMPTLHCGQWLPAEYIIRDIHHRLQSFYRTACINERIS